MQPETTDTIEQACQGIVERAQRLSDDELPAIERVCNDIAGRMQQMGQQIKAQQKVISELLRHAGEKGVCKGPRCRQEIVFVLHRDTGKYTPYNADGTNHYTTCVDRDQFHKGRK